jgi:P27 family predicted phage terminase small subunit
MTHGPPPVPFIVRKLRGNPGKRSMRPPPEPALLPAPPEPPEWLTPHAREEWGRVAGDLQMVGLLTAVDLAALAAYCWSYSVWRTASEQLAAEGLTDVTQDGRQCRHALTKTAREAAADMIRYAGEFGLTPVARTRIAAGVRAEPPSRFDGLLA